MTTRFSSFTDSTAAAGVLCVLGVFAPTAQGATRHEELHEAIRVSHDATSSTGLSMRPLFAGDWAVDYLADALGEAGKHRVEMFEALRVFCR